MTQEGSSQDDLKAVWAAFWSGWAHLLLSEAPRAWRGGASRHPPRQQQAAKYYHAEREKIVRHMVQPVGMGLFVTAFCFATFRISSSRWWMKFSDTYFRSSSSSAAKKGTAAKVWGHLTAQAQQQQEKVGELMQLPLDLGLSVLLGSSAFLMLYDSEKFQEDLVQIPLLPGHSLVHSSVCPGVVRTVQEHAHLYRGETTMTAMNDDKSSNSNNEETTRKFFAHFAENCQTRSRYLEHRTKLGLPHPNLVPYPGLKGRAER